MVNYQNGKIYRIPVGDEEYIGSTAQTLSQRRNNHFQKSKVANYKLYQAINNLPEQWNGISLYLLEKYPCNSKEELEARERYWIEQRKPSLNHKIPTRTKAEYKTTQKGKDIDKSYREQHKEKAKEYKKDWYANNAAVIKEKRSTKEFKEQRNKKLQSIIHHCGVCDINIMGALSTFKKHCQCKSHIEKSNVIV